MLPALLQAIPMVSQGAGGITGGLGQQTLGVGKLIYGLTQRKKANKLKPEDFQYIPPALLENLASQRNRARSARMPGQSLAESKVRQSTAAGLKAAGAGSLADKIAATQGLVANEQNALAGIGAQAAQFQLGEERALQGIMNQRAGFEAAGQEKFERTKAELLGAGTQNIFGGASGILSGAAQMAGAFGNTSPDAWSNLGQGVSTAKPQASTAGLDSFMPNFVQQNYQPATLGAGTFLNRYQDPYKGYVGP